LVLTGGRAKPDDEGDGDVDIGKLVVESDKGDEDCREGKKLVELVGE